MGKERDRALVVDKVTKRFGGVVALQGVVLEVAPGERRAIVGPNGAGKTTLLNVLSGLIRHDEGRIYVNGIDVSAWSAARRARLGLGRTFQVPNVFAELPVEANLWLAAEAGLRWGGRGNSRVALRGTATEWVAELLQICGLEDVRHNLTSFLPYGKVRRLEVALALAAQPSILLLDEPTAGLSEAESEGLLQLIRKLGRSVTVVVVEHNMNFALKLVDRVTVLHQGRVLWEGGPREITNASEVVRVYFGG
jgi:branched-chain amino acid transport system ATP-binding protein